ncbi:MAG: Gfo/Idh/MocA family protein [Gemmataceae bacterium]
MSEQIESIGDELQQDSHLVGVAVVGCGYWGPNLIRNFNACPTSRVVMICDRDPARLEHCQKVCPTALPTRDFEDVLNHPDVQAVSIATPVATHAPLSLTALQAGKHVIVEKPMAMSVQEAEEMVALAKKLDRVLMVDHTFIYSPAIRKVKALVDTGELGELFYIDSVRINLGLFQTDVNVVWDLAPHDLSIVDYLLGKLPKSIAAMGSRHIDPQLEDVAYLNMDFGNNLLASFHLNWLSPVKIRHLIVGGSKKGLVYNDLNPWEPIKIYDHGVQVNPTTEDRRGILISYRTGDIHSPHVGRAEPLQNVARHFIECIQEKRTPLTDGEAGLRVVRILDAAQRSIRAQGGRITL